MVEGSAEETAEFVSSKQNELNSFLIDILSAESTYGNEAEVQRRIGDSFRDLGYQVEEVPMDEALREDPEYTNTDQPVAYLDRPNLVIILGEDGPGRSAILNTHSDVVPAGPWEEAFKPRIDDGRLVGRGAADAKGHVGALFLLAMMLREYDTDLQGGLEAQVVIEEEIGGNGSLSLIRQGHRADAVVVVEGSDFAVCPANRGAVWFKATVEGRAVHMAKKFDGVSAIDRSMELIDLLYQYEDELAKASTGQPLFVEYDHPVQVNVGRIEAGDWPSTVPALAVLEGGVGFLPNKDLETVKREIAALPGRGGKWLSSHARIEFNRLHNDAYEIPVEHPLVKTLFESARSAQVSTRIRGMIASCDARLFNRVGGMPTVAFGAGDIESAHSVGESVRLDDLAKEACALFEFAKNWCGS